MKKIISMVLIAMLALSFATVGSAAVLTTGQVDAADQVYVMASEESEDIIVSAVAEDGVITVTYDSSVLAAVENAQATIIIFDATTVATPSAGNMIQIDQFEFDPDNTTYSYPYNAEKGQTIIVMMGGTDIDNPGMATAELAGVAAGDVDGSGYVTLDDALAVARYTVTGLVGGVAATDEFKEVADFNKDGNVTMVDVLMIAYTSLL